MRQKRDWAYGKFGNLCGRFEEGVWGSGGRIKYGHEGEGREEKLLNKKKDLQPK